MREETSRVPGDQISGRLRDERRAVPVLTGTLPRRIERVLLSPRSSPDFARGILEAVGRNDAPWAGTALIEQLGALAPAARIESLGIP